MHDEQVWIFKRANLTPNNIALIDIDSGRKWTYHHLVNEIAKWSRYLVTFNLKKGDRVALLAENTIDAFALLFACSIGGYIFVPFNWRLSPKELAHIVGDCMPTLLLYEKSFTHLVEPLAVQHKILLSDVVLDEGDSLISSCDWHEKDPWLMIYTGGTTGRPKGVVLSFNAVNWNAMNTVISWGLSAEDCTLNYMPLFHTGGLNALALPLLMCGGTVVIGKHFNAEQAIQNINQYKTTISLFVPTMYQAMIGTDYFKTSDFPTVKVFLSGGAPCPRIIYQHFKDKGLRFKEGYGLTEAGPNNFYISPDVACKKPGSVGKAMQFNQVRLVNKDGQDCIVNGVGELLVKGKHMFSGYWNNPEETKKTIVDGWIRTGDLAKVDEDGDYYIVGRKKEMIITGGENVYPQEVEQCILQHPNVKEVAVIGVKDIHWGEVVTAFIVNVQYDDSFEEKIIAYCQQSLGRYKVPKKVHLINQLPKTDVGKIDKKKLADMSEKGLSQSEK